MTLTVLPPSVIHALEAGIPAIRAFREATGKSVEAFARDSGIDLSRLRAIEAGDAPTLDEAYTIAVGLGISVEDLRRDS